MNASIKGALAQINVSWKAFIHKGKPMTKEQVKAVLQYGSEVGYKSTSELKEKEIDEIIDKVNKRNIGNKSSINNDYKLF